MPFTFDGSAKTITEVREAGDPALVQYDALVELYSEAIRLWATDAYSRYDFPFRAEGGAFRRTDSAGADQYASMDLYLQNQPGSDWSYVFADYDHTVRFSGVNLYSEDENLPMWGLDRIASDVIVEIDFSDVQTGYQISAAGGLSSAQIAEISSTIAGLVPQSVWEYSGGNGRTLTDVPPNAATAAALANTYALLSQIGQSVEAGDIRLNDTQLGRIADSVWTAPNGQIALQELAAAAQQDTLSQAVATLNQTQATVDALTTGAIASAVWSATTRELTGQDQGTLTDAQVAAIATAVWGVSDRGMNLDEIYSLLGLDSTKPVTAHKDNDTGYTELTGIRLNRTQTIGPTGEITVVQQRQTP